MIYKKPSPRQYLLQKQCVEAAIARGERAIAFMVEKFCQDRADEILGGMLPPVRDCEASSQVIDADALDGDDARLPAKRRGRLDFEFYASEPDPEESWTQPKSATGPKVLRPNDFPGLCHSASHVPLETNLS